MKLFRSTHKGTYRKEIAAKGRVFLDRGWVVIEMDGKENRFQLLLDTDDVEQLEAVIHPVPYRGQQ